MRNYRSGLPKWIERSWRVLCSELVLTPAIIAEDIGRSREAVSRRLNTLEAGGLVKKVERGKYRITDDAFMMIAEPAELPEEELQTAIAEEQARERAIEESLGITAAQYRQEVDEKYSGLLRKKGEDKSSDEILREAFHSVEKK